MINYLSTGAGFQPSTVVAIPSPISPIPKCTGNRFSSCVHSAFLPKNISHVISQTRSVDDTQCLARARGIETKKTQFVKGFLREKTVSSWWLNQPHLKNMLVSNWDHSPRNRGETKKYLKPPPRLRVLREKRYF